MAKVDEINELQSCSPSCSPSGGRRPAAGEDPVKREQILDGAQRVFMRLGFDAASMNDITKEAGVSKGTLYVYFENKEDLFAAMIQRQKMKIVGLVQKTLEREGPVEEVLFEAGVVFATHLLSERAIQGARMVIGVIDRMPGPAHVFFSAGPNSGPLLITRFLARQIELGTLRNIEDVALAAWQFGDLCLAGLYRPRLFGMIEEMPSKERIENNVRSAVRMFMNTYGA